MGLSTRRNVAARGPTCLLAPGQMSAAMPALAEPLTVLAGRGDKRTKRGKRKSHSFGNVGYPPFLFDHCRLIALYVTTLTAIDCEALTFLLQSRPRDPSAVSPKSRTPRGGIIGQP